MKNEFFHLLLSTSGKIEAAQTFYGKLFPSWTFKEQSINGRDYVKADPGDGPGGHFVAHGGGDANMEPTGWTTFVRVAGIDESLRIVKSEGGRILVGKTAFRRGFYSIIEDPSGNHVGLWERPA